MMDLQHKGYVTMEEFVKLLKGLQMTEEKAKWIFDAIDANHDGKVH